MQTGEQKPGESLAERLQNELRRGDLPWGARVFNSHLLRAHLIRQTLYLSTLGISRFLHAGKMERARLFAEQVLATPLEEFKEPLSTRSDFTGQPSVQEADALERLANAEVERGFPFLFTQALVSLWGTLEAYVRDILVGWLLHNDAARSRPELRKVRVRAMQFNALPEAERMRLVVDELYADIGTARGIGRHERVLAAVGLPGTLHTDVEKSLRELCEVRNAVVHNAGICDSTLADRCPWLGFRCGAPITVTPADFERYYRDALEYMIDVVTRVLLDAVPADVRELIIQASGAKRPGSGRESRPTSESGTKG